MITAVNEHSLLFNEAADHVLKVSEELNRRLMQYPTLPEVLNLAERLGAAEVRDYGLLESALARPGASVFGQDAYPDVWQKAAH